MFLLNLIIAFVMLIAFVAFAYDAFRFLKEVFTEE